MADVTIIKVRQGLSGYPYSICTGDGHFISNAETMEQIKERYSFELKRKSVKLVKELSLYPEGMKPVYHVYGYARVSTATQARDGNSLEAQTEQLTAAGAEKIYTDAYTGTESHRPELDKLMQELKPGDTLIITKLDRVARSCTQGEELVKKLLERRITINILNMGVLNNTPAAKLMRQMFFAFAEFERDMIIARTQEGKEVAKRKAEAEGRKFIEGRPKTDQARLDHAMHLLIDEHNSYKAVHDMTGLSISTLTRERRRLKAKDNNAV